VTSRLLLIRHAQTDQMMVGRCCGALDVDLSPQGVRHAEVIAATLSTVPIAAIYTSPLRRAMASAQPLADLLHRELLVEDDLREMDFGECEGATFSEIEARFPDLYREWMTSPSTVTFPGGESFAVVQQRSWALVTALRSRHPHELVAVFTHAGVVRSLLAQLLAMPDNAAFRLGQDYGALNVVDWTTGDPVLRVMNLRWEPTDTGQGSPLSPFLRFLDKED
jgi:broad specificity phosphatase PhoE